MIENQARFRMKKSGNQLQEIKALAKQFSWIETFGGNELLDAVHASAKAFVNDRAQLRHEFLDAVNAPARLCVSERTKFDAAAVSNRQ